MFLLYAGLYLILASGCRSLTVCCDKIDYRLLREKVSRREMPYF